MQIVIDISDKAYGLLKYFEKSLGLNDKKDSNDDLKTALMRAVINGTPLPKGHGGLVDFSEVLIKLMQFYDGDKSIGQCLDEVNTIIEADKGRE